MKIRQRGLAQSVYCIGYELDDQVFGSQKTHKYFYFSEASRHLRGVFYNGNKIVRT